MDLPAPLSCFSRGFARPTSKLSEQRNLRMRKSMSSKKPVRPWPDRPEWVLQPCSHSHPHQARRKHFLSGTATGEGNVGRGHPSARSAENFFHLHSSVVWIGSRSTFVLCTALPRLYLAMGAGGATAPQRNWLQSRSIIKKLLFHSS